MSSTAIQSRHNMNIYLDATVSASTLETIKSLVSSHQTLEQVINWGLAQDPPKLFADTIQQDEFTIDVIIPYDDNLYLVYAVT